MNSTAETLGAYRKALIDQDLPEALTDAIVMDAAQAVHRDQTGPTVPGPSRADVDTAAAERRAQRDAELAGAAS